MTSFDALDISLWRPVKMGEGGEGVTTVENGTKNGAPSANNPSANKRKSKKVQPSDGSVSWELADDTLEGYNTFAIIQFAYR